MGGISEGHEISKITPSVKGRFENQTAKSSPSRTPRRRSISDFFRGLLIAALIQGLHVL
jgi:hypothetical protein